MKNLTWIAAVVLTTAVVAASRADTQLLLRDDFNGSGIVDPTVWRLPFDSEGTFVGRTQFRGNPATDLPLQGIAEAGATDGLVAEIHLDTFSPIDPGNQFLGTDLLTKRDFARGGGLSFESRLRLAPTATGAGIINGFFTFDVSRNLAGVGDVRDEIDFELLGNEVANGNQGIFTNVFNDDGFTGPESAGDGLLQNVAGLDLTQFQTYRVDWTPDAVRWFVNGNVIRTQTTDVPDDPQRLHFNIWAPGSEFAEAFDAALQPTAVEANNQRFTAQIDHVEVNRFNTTVSDNLLTDGSFETTVPTLLDSPSIEIVPNQWFSFNNASVVAGVVAGVTPEDGVFVGQTFGPFQGSTNASGLLQRVAAEPGQEFEVSASAITPNGDSIAGTENFTSVQISFVDSDGAVLEASQFVPLDGSDFPLLDGRDPNIIEDVFVDGTASAVAPEGTAFAQVQLLFVQLVPGNTDDEPGDPAPGDPGAVFFDDVSLVLLTPDEPLFSDGDHNFDGVVSAADFTVFRDGASVNGLGTLQDFDAFVASFGAGSALAAATVPEPSAALLLLAGLLAAHARRC